MKTKSAPQTARKRTKKNALLLIVAAAALCGLPAVALADTCFLQRTWVGSSGSWFEPTNWNDGHIPTSGSSAQINNRGAATIDRAGAEGCDLALGLDAGDSGTVSLDGGSLSIVNDAQVGAFGTGTLKIANGGSVTAAVVVIAGSSGSVGMVSVDGASLTIRGAGACVVGGDAVPGGTGLLTVTNGGTVSASSAHLYKSGTLTGNGMVSTPNGTNVEGTLKPSGRLTIGSGNLTITNGGTMVCSVTQQAWDNVYVASPGTATIDSFNSKLIVTMTGTFTTPADFPLLYARGGLFGRFFSVSIIFSTGCLSPSIRYDYDNGYVYLHVESSCQ